MKELLHAVCAALAVLASAPPARAEASVPGAAREPEAPAKYALCVGINRYDNVSSLRGCVNDAAFFRAGLVRLGGWPEENAALLADFSATKAAIRGTIADAAARAVPGDTFVYAHSSHGGSDGGTSVHLCACDGNYRDEELAEDLGAFAAVSGTVYRVCVCGYSTRTGSIRLSWRSAEELSVELQEAVDNRDLTFWSGGNAPWRLVEDPSAVGGDSARSGETGNGGTSWMAATGASGPGIVSFRWKVSSEKDFDYAEFLLDGDIKTFRSGTGGGWIREAFAVGEGTHSFKWCYSKDRSVRRGSDCVWADRVTWTPGSPLAPVYRFWSKNYRGHFYTADEGEKNHLVRTNPNWKYEGVAFHAWASPEAFADARRATRNAPDARRGTQDARRGTRDARRAVPAWTLEAADGTAVAVPGATDAGGALVETRADAPDADELAAGAARRGAAAAPADGIALRLALPAGPFGAALWSAADGTVAEEDAEGSFAFGLPPSGVWHWLRVRGADGSDAFSVRLRAE